MPFLLSLYKMVDVFSMLLFILLLYSIACVSAFKGNVYMRCRKTPAPVNGTWEIDTSVTRLCNAYGLGDFECPAGTYCGSPDMYDIKLTDSDIYGTPMTWYGAIGFDDVFRAFIANYQLVTLEDWATLMYRMQDSNGTGFSQVLFLSLIFIGNYFLVNLIVAVIVNTFQSYRGSTEIEETPLVQNPKSIKGDNTPELQDPSTPAKKPTVSRCSSLTIQKVLQREDSYRPTPMKTILPSQQKKKREPPPTCIQSFCQKIQSSKIFFGIIFVLILMNLVLLSLDRVDISEKEQKIIDGLDIMIFALFIIESLINTGASNFNEYICSSQGIVDMITNFLGVIEVCLTYTEISEGIFIMKLCKK